MYTPDLLSGENKQLHTKSLDFQHNFKSDFTSYIQFSTTLLHKMSVTQPW